MEMPNRACRPGVIYDVAITALRSHRDDRGSLSEFHRDTWHGAVRPVQWDYIATEAGVLRGVHVHRKRTDLFVVVEGHATIGLHDLRRASASFGVGMTIRVDGHQPAVITVPPGVAHGILAHDALRHLYGLTAYFDEDDQAGCRWDDPRLCIDWLIANPRLLERDAALPSLSALLAAFEAAGGVALPP